MTQLAEDLRRRIAAVRAGEDSGYGEVRSLRIVLEGAYRAMRELVVITECVGLLDVAEEERELQELQGLVSEAEALCQ